jgi:dipeptidyl-peptidase-4
MMAYPLAVAAQKQITIDDFTVKNTFAQKSVNGINWMKNGKFYTSIKENAVVRFDITTGLPTDTIVDGTDLSPKLTIHDYSFSQDEKKLLLVTEFESIYRRSFKAEYFVYDIEKKSLAPLSKNGKQSYATFSPQGNNVAFVRGNNLFNVNLADLSETQITTDGKFNFIINGSSDWVYEEEFGFAQAFYWSPDGKKLAYYRFDETNVREYNLQKWNKGQLYPEDYRYKYPKAGEQNSVIEIWTYNLDTKKKVKADIGTEKDIYIPRVKWTNDPSLLSISRMNRLQNKLEILHTNADTGSTTIALTEASDTYVDINYTDDLTYLKNGKQFVYATEKSGYKHIYLYNLDGSLVNAITAGEWEVVELVGIDEKTKTAYYISTEAGNLNREFYSISLNGKKKLRLSKESGTHAINLSTDYQFYIDYHSSGSAPLAVSLHKTEDNTLIKTLEKNDELKATLADYGIQGKEFFKYPSADGVTLLDGYFIKPQNFNPTHKYPVMVYQYSGPRNSSVQNSFGAGANFYMHHMLAQKGILVAVIDTRGTGFRGEKFTKQTYKQLGKLETEDLVAGAKYLGTLAYVDKDRLGIWGWSFGGYMTSLAMTKGAGAYKLGIAGAPVTNWRYYDNIYTERFLQRPQDNPSGYDDNSPTTHAAKLQGHFLLIHGTGDDNVHFQNSVVLEDALINAGKQFHSFYYPDQAHGFRGGKVNYHRAVLMVNFILENL